jgi:hypothetical protein
VSAGSAGSPIRRAIGSSCGSPPDIVFTVQSDLIANQRSAFNMPAETAYFNTANLAPQLRAVRAAGEAALERRGRPWTITAKDWFVDVERLRGLFAALRGTSLRLSPHLHTTDDDVERLFRGLATAIAPAPGGPPPGQLPQRSEES